MKYDYQIILYDCDNDLIDDSASTKLRSLPIEVNENNHNIEKPLGNRQLDGKIHNDIAKANDHIKVQEKAKKNISDLNRQREFTQQMNNSIDQAPTSAAIVTFQSNREITPTSAATVNFQNNREIAL